MLARRLLALLALEALAYAFVVGAAAAGELRWSAAIAIVVLTHLALRCFAAPLGVLVAVVANPRGAVPRLGLADAVTVLARECAALWRNYSLAPFDPWLKPGPAAHPHTGRSQDVVLVHGILCNRVVWRPFQAALARRGYASRAVNLQPLLGSLDAMAEYLAAQLRGAPGPVQLVAHSMGGLVARRALQLHPELPIAGIVTIGTPHHGAAQAALAPGMAARSMRPGSRWLEELDRGERAAACVRCLAIRSLHDELVSPASAARWPGAAELVLTGVGHVALLGDPRVIDRVIAEIDAVAAADGRGSPADHPDAGVAPATVG